MNEIGAGVIGAGVFGTFHARKYAGLDGVALVGVYDPDPDRASALADELGVQAFADLDELLSAVQVVTVASPADTHAEMADRALLADRHVYVEKPLATTISSGEALVDRAGRRRLILACGHQERVTFGAMGLIDTPEAPSRIESVRRGLFSERSRDVSCVLDLMIHDLDLALILGGDDVLEIHAKGGADEVQAEIVFRSGLHAKLEASRIARARDRTMRLTYPSGQVQIDFLTPAFRNTTAFRLNPDFAATAQGRDPLGVSVSSFLDTVKGRRDRPIATGQDGLRALQLALDVERAAGLR
jgi:predicted dehydrogenase